MSDLTDRTALVTGSSGNIGRAIAESFAEAGADVGITAKSDRDGCEETADRVRSMGSRTAVATGDLSDPEDLTEIVDDVRDELGPIDILINNATHRSFEPFLDVTLEDWQAIHDVDLRAMFLLCQQTIPDMIESGRGNIVNIAGVTVFTGLPGYSHVIANKAGITGLTRAVALEFGADGVRSNALCLGSIDTGESIEDESPLVQEFTSRAALGREGRPEEVARICRFLASEESSFVTGQVIHANGGLFPISNMGP